MNYVRTDITGCNIQACEHMINRVHGTCMPSSAFQSNLTLKLNFLKEISPTLTADITEENRKRKKKETIEEKMVVARIDHTVNPQPFVTTSANREERFQT